MAADDQHLEGYLTQYCIASVRIFGFVREFLSESSYFDHFVFHGGDLCLLLRKEMVAVKELFQARFKNEIPLLSDGGHLVFGKDAEKSKRELLAINNTYVKETNFSANELGN